MWLPWGLHGDHQHGPRGEGPAQQAGVGASLPPRARPGPHGAGGQPPAARGALLHQLHQGLHRAYY